MSAVSGRQALVDSATSEFEKRTGRSPLWRWHVPGRIEIFGKHTDYAGGESLLAAVPRGFAVVAAPRSDDDLRVIDGRHHDEALIAASDPSPRRGWTNYAAVTFHRLLRDFPGVSLGTDIAIASDLPRAAGISSSSALVVGLATALIRRGQLDLRDDWQRVIASTEDLAWYLGCVENGLDFKTLAGSAGVGTHGGSQDHTAILGCLEGHVSRFGFMPVRRLADVAMPADWTFVVMSSGVHADKAGSVRDRYNRASLAVRALVGLWQADSGVSAVSLGAIVSGAPEAEAHLQSLLGSSSVDGFAPADLQRRLAQFSREFRRVSQAAAAFAAADRTAIEALTRESQSEAEDLLGNQIPQTIALARLAYEQGAFAASAFGAGFGGSVWALTDAADAGPFARRWYDAYVSACKPSGHVEWFTCRPEGGAREL